MGYNNYAGEFICLQKNKKLVYPTAKWELKKSVYPTVKWELKKSVYPTVKWELKKLGSGFDILTPFL